MNPRTCTLALAVVLGLVIPAAQAADPTYKSTMPDGRVVYGESPQPGARRVDKLAPPPEVTGVIVADDAAKAAAVKIPAPSTGVAIIPERPRVATKPATQGLIQNQGDKLPSRSY